MVVSKRLKVFVTGANGFIGQSLVNYLGRREYDVYAMVREGTIPGFNINDKVTVVWGDMQDASSLEKIIPSGSVVINLAANPYDPKLSRLVNVEGTKKLLAVCENNKINKIVHISSQATKITKKGVYSITKGESDRAVSASKFDWVILKPSLVYGDGEKGLFNKIKAMVRMLPFVPVFGDGEVKVNPIHVDDLCKYIELVVGDPKNKGMVFDVGCLTPISYNKLYCDILGYLGKRNPLWHIPVWMGIAAGNFFRFLGMKSPPFYIDNVLGSTQETHCDAVPIVKKYGFSPREFDEGLRSIFCSKKTRIAVVGLGKMGMMHLAALSAMEDVRTVALVDSNKKSWAVIKNIGVTGNFYDNLREALRKEKPDGVYILTPTFTHKKLLMQCLKEGLSVFVEKPLGLNAREINQLKKVAKLYPDKVFVGYTLLFKRAINGLKRMVVDKRYGQIKGFRASYEHGEVFGQKRGWMFDKSKSGGGVLMNPGPHLFSVVSYLVGIPKKISGRIDKVYSSEIDDVANLKLKYDDFEGELFLSWSVKGMDIPKMVIEVDFEQAKVSSDGKSITILSNGKRTVLAESSFPPLVKGMFELNPEANGEAYSTEDYLFIRGILSVPPGMAVPPVNDLRWVCDTELMIHNSYKASNFS